MITNRFGLYSNELKIYGNLNSSGLGCQGGNGLGGGLVSNDNCTATGGSHGGYSGYSINYSTREKPAQEDVFKSSF